MKILVTGREGQVARSLAEQARAKGAGGHELVFVSRPDIDLLDPASIEHAIADVCPNLIISAAAYTAVDQAEDEPDLAMRANGKAPGVIGRAAAKVGARVIHLSTDYVFDGQLSRPWRDDDPVGPIGVYGQSKLAGEEALALSGANYAILRTAWVYSPFGNNFVKTMLQLAADRNTIDVVADQYGNPTSAIDIADGLLAMVANWQDVSNTDTNQIYHFAGAGETNWADFARAIFAESARHGGPTCEITGIATSDYPTRAVRPANSRLECKKFADTFGHRTPCWEVSLAKVVTRLLGPE